MGQKINPIGLRSASTAPGSRGSPARRIRQAVAQRHEDPRAADGRAEAAAISKIVIERPHKKCRVNIHSARPAVIGQKRAPDIDKLRKQVAKLTRSESRSTSRGAQAEITPTLVADSIAQQLERRVAFRAAR